MCLEMALKTMRRLNSAYTICVTLIFGVRHGPIGNVFKKTVTRPLPPNAEIITRQGVRLARWHDAKGKTKTAPVIDREGRGRAHPRRVGNLRCPLPRRRRFGRRSLDRVPGQDGGSKRSRRPGAESRASAVWVAHAGRSANRRAPGDADRRALRCVCRRPRRGRIG